jgi:outer membrane protein TolC
MPPTAGFRPRSARPPAGLAALWLAGCATPAPPALPPAVSEPAVRERVALAPPVVPEPPPPAPPEPTTFTPAEAVAYALAHNPRLRAAEAEVDRARARRDVAGTPLLPHLDLLNRFVGTSPNLGAGTPGVVGIIPTRGTKVTNLLVQSELQLQWTLIDFGRTANRLGQAAAQERVAAARLTRAGQTVALDAATAYLQVLLAKAGEQTQRDAVRSAEAFLEDARAKRKAGTADRNDELRAEVLTAGETDKLVEARRQVAAAEAGLNNAMGRNPGLPVRVAELADPPPLGRPLAAYLDAAAATRPEVGIARDNVAAAVADRGARAAEFRPRVYTLAGLGVVEGQNVATGLDGGAGLHLNTPIYDGGLRRGELRAADAAVAAATADAQKVFDDVALQVHLAYREAEAAAERTKLARPAVEQAREYLRLTRVRYGNGDATPADVADAEATATRSEDRYHAAAYESLAALARLGYATGDGPGAYLPTPASTEALPAPRPAAELPPPKAVPGPDGP